VRRLPITKEEVTSGASGSCPVEPACAMYALFSLAGMQGLWQSLYCHADYQRCERFKLADRGHPVPRGLLPDGKELRITKVPRADT
jgi:hypothetical protein